MAESRDLSRGEATRAKLLDAAVTAFSEHGFHGTTTRDIASAAGMSPAAVYVHHSSKEELLYLISKAGHDTVITLLEQAVDSAGDPVDQLRAAVHAFAVHHVRSHVAARVVNYELAALSDRHQAEIQIIRHRIDQLFTDLVARGTAAGVFDPPNQRMAVVALQSLGIDIARWYREGGWSEDEIADAYVEMALRIVGA
ncbi:MAG: TetR family transcriptional regulator [Nocardioidaceae bacterium]|nr:TetR family transcriptional regulator [Nocardioidaceae bacterium]